MEFRCSNPGCRVKLKAGPDRWVHRSAIPNNDSLVGERRRLLPLFDFGLNGLPNALVRDADASYPSPPTTGALSPQKAPCVHTGPT